MTLHLVENKQEACGPTRSVLSSHDHGYVAQVLTRAADGKNPIEKAQQAVKVWHSSTVLV